MKILLFATAILLPFLAGCSVHRATINVYTDPTLKPGEIRSVAVFPIRNARLAPSEAQELNRKISQAISSIRPGIRLMSSAEATSVLNEKGLAGDWATFLEQYVSSGVPNATTLASIGSALGVDAIVQGELVNVQQQDGRFGVTVGTTRVTVRLTMLDPKRGKLLWEASSDGLRMTADSLSPAPPVVEAIDLAIAKLTENLPGI